MKHTGAVALPSVSTRTVEFTPTELPLEDCFEAPGPVTEPRHGPLQRLREALRRWFEQEM